jgi:alanine racemase
MIELQDLLEATGGRVHGSVFADRFFEFAFDSRRLGEPRSEQGGPLFVAVKTDTGDGHDYILEAVHKGAAGVLCQWVPSDWPRGVTCLVVNDTRQALFDWARLVLRKTSIPVVAVTGSSGKTVTKEAIAAVLSTHTSVFKNERSFSGRYGLPIALGRLEPSHRVAVLELAADSLHEIQDLTQLTRPAVGVVTTINEAHLDSFGSLESIEREKGRLIEALPVDGLAVLNRDDERVWRMRERTPARVVGVALSEHPDLETGYVATDIRYSTDGLSFSLCRQPDETAESTPFLLRLLGRHHAYAALAAFAVGREYGVPIPQIQSALSRLDPLPGRLRPLPGLGGSVLLDDSYDADLACTLAALDALVDHFPRQRRTVVLGGIDRLNQREVADRLIGDRAARVAHELILKGDGAQAVRQAAMRAGMDAQHVFETYTNAEAVRYLAGRLGANDVALVKGARRERMEEIARGLMRTPEHAPRLLVRQEPAFRSVQLALPERPTWLRVDLEAIASNLSRVRQIVGDDVSVMAVLKADGYGHGAIRIARTAANNGARMLGVACLSEGIVLRRARIDTPILVLGYTPAWQAREAILNDITATVFDLDTAHAFSRAAGELGRVARVHIKVDTGMGRLGLLPPQVLPFLKDAARLPNLMLEGIFTHFSIADVEDKTYTLWQLDRFRAVLKEAGNEGIRFPIVHAANSAALLTVPRARFNMVRLGIALYGLAPSVDTPLPPGFRPALAFETRIAQVKTLPAGSYVSYGNTYRTPSEHKIAVIPVGYADGFRRAPTHWGHVLVRAQRAPIVGRVCMDQTMIDVTHIPNVRQGDLVVLIGRQGGEAITVEQVAEQLGTINYEVISEILARVPRVS